MAILLFNDGSVFRGNAFGYQGTTMGEICFNTSMTGYQEIFTDPSYYGQVLIMNNVHIGNYGVFDNEKESKDVKIKGLIGRNLETAFSRIKSKESLNTYLQKNKVVAISGLDTRALVAYIRNKGCMNVIISSETQDLNVLQQQLADLPPMEGQNLAPFVSTPLPYVLGNPKAKTKIAVLDYGIKQNILNCLLTEDVCLKVFPYNTPFEDLLTFDADGYFFSNGPGDPAAMTQEINVVKKILTLSKPSFGICLGHQLIAIASGLKTIKLKYGHRGSNHPVKNIQKNIAEITTQNHGFGVDDKSLQNNPNISVTHINLNDKTIEGIKLKNAPVFSVQYHPESSPGPWDSRYLFDDFKTLILDNQKK